MRHSIYTITFTSTTIQNSGHYTYSYVRQYKINMYSCPGIRFVKYVANIQCTTAVSLSQIWEGVPFYFVPQTAKRLDGFLAREITIVSRPQHPNMEPYMKDIRRIGRSDFNMANPFVLMGDKPPPVRGVWQRVTPLSPFRTNARSAELSMHVYGVWKVAGRPTTI